MLPDPVTDLNVIGMSIFGESRGLRLFGSEETLLLLRGLEQASGCITMGLSHSTILQIYCRSVKKSVAFMRNRAAMPNTMPTSYHDIVSLGLL